jgi:hypothetical protein
MLWCPFGQRGAHDDAVETRFVRRSEPRRIRVRGEAEDGDVRVRLGDLVRVHPGEIDDHEIGRIDAVGGREPVAVEQHVELASKEEIDPNQQDRRHGGSLTPKKRNRALLASPGVDDQAFADRVGAWFAREGRETIADPVYLRQMNMAIALAASRWNEFAEAPDAPARMRTWLDEIERRARARGADARVDAISRVRSWLEDSQEARRNN